MAPVSSAAHRHKFDGLWFPEPVAWLFSFWGRELLKNYLNYRVPYQQVQKGKPIPWSQRFFLKFFFAKERASRKAATTSREAARRKRKTSGYFGLESHFHADDSCQTRQIANNRSDQWQLGKHVLISRYFLSGGRPGKLMVSTIPPHLGGEEW